MRAGFIVPLFALTFPAHAQEGHLGYGHDKWHQGFYKTLQRLTAKARVATSPTAVQLRGGPSMDTTR